MGGRTAGINPAARNADSLPFTGRRAARRPLPAGHQQRHRHAELLRVEEQPELNGAVLAHAATKDRPWIEMLVKVFLSVRKPGSPAGAGGLTPGLFKARLILAAVLLECGRTDLAARVEKSLIGVSRDLLQHAREDLLGDVEECFWEVTDRQLNLDYLTPARKAHVADILRMRSLVDSVYLDDKVKEYIIDLVVATRDPQAFKLDLAPFIQYGASPRATLYLTLAAKAHAFISGRGYVTPQDVKSIGGDVLRHRITVSYEAEAEEMTSDTIVQRIFDGVPVP